VSSYLHKILRFAPFLVAAAVVALAGAKYFVGKMPSSCEAVGTITTLPSPDRRNEIQSTETSCADLAGTGGDTYSLILKGTIPANEGTTIFVTQGEKPEVSWTDANHVSISITHLMDIVLSLHSVGSVTINYRFSPVFSKKLLAVFGSDLDRVLRDSSGPVVQH
jgi:hypothetical protein